MVIQAILIIPFLRVLTPSIFLIHWECLSLLIFSSCRTAQSLFLASCLLPGPTWCSRPRRHLTWALIAVTDRSPYLSHNHGQFLVRSTIRSAFWQDLKLEPCPGQDLHKVVDILAGLTQGPSPMMSPNSSSLLSTGPLCLLFVPDIVWSRAFALSQ